MSTKTAPAMAAQPMPAPAVVPATEYERFIAALPESFRDECRSKLDGSRLAANHPVFHALAELYEKEASKPARDFIQEATLHADRATQLLNDFQKIPQAILAQIEPQLLGLRLRLKRSTPKTGSSLDGHAVSRASAASLRRGGIVTETERTIRATDSGKNRARGSILWRGQFDHLEPDGVDDDRFDERRDGGHDFSVGAAHLSHSYEAAYQDRVAHMEADSTSNTIALNRLLVAGISLKVERSPDANAWYLILPGAHRATQPVSSPEGLAVEVWP